MKADLAERAALQFLLDTNHRCCRIVRGLALALMIGGAAASPASAVELPGGKEGVERAKKAGIYVDPLMERMMAQAPAGSCVNDPSQAGCPKVTAAVYSPEFFAIPDDQRPKVDATATGKRAKRIVARAAAYNCGVKLVHDSPYKAAGYEQMDGQNLCFHPISDLDVYMRLDKWYDGRWYSGMANRWFYPTNPNQYPWSGSLRFDCVSESVKRWWRAYIAAYVIYNGVLYGGEASAQNENYCG